MDYVDCIFTTEPVSMHDPYKHMVQLFGQSDGRRWKIMSPLAMARARCVFVQMARHVYAVPQ
eukprot:910095-Rhodomonas_salina.1